jgi:hypothetical protein
VAEGLLPVVTANTQVPATFCVRKRMWKTPAGAQQLDRKTGIEQVVHHAHLLARDTAIAAYREPWQVRHGGYEMKHLRFPVMLLLVMVASLRGQPSNLYAFLAPGGATCCGATSMTVQFGAGGEAVLWKGVGVGAELGVMGTHEDFGGTALGVFSPNGYYDFIHRSNLRFDPFVTGGYTLFFRSGTASLFNFGGGATYWFHPRVPPPPQLSDAPRLLFRTGGSGRHGRISAAAKESEHAKQPGKHGSDAG